MDKILKHADSLASQAASSQGGSVQNAGPDSSASPKASGDAVTNPTFYTKQEASRENGGGPKNKFHDV